MIDLRSALRLGLNPGHPDVVALVGGGGKSTTLFRLARECASAGHRVVVTATTHLAAVQLQKSPVYLVVPGQAVPWDRLAQALDDHGQCLLVAAAEEPRCGNLPASPEKIPGIRPQLVDAVAGRAQELGIGAVLVEADGSRNRPVKAPAQHEPVLPGATTLLVPMLGLDALGMPIEEPHVHRPEQVTALVDEFQQADGPKQAEAGRLFLTPAMAASLLIHPRGGAQGQPAQARLLPLLNKAEPPLRLILGRLATRQLAQRGQASLLGTVGDSSRLPVQERWAPVAAVVLAAGGSSRMEQPKQLLRLDDEPLVVRATRLALESGAQQVLVVVGAHAGQVATALTMLQARDDRVQIVPNPAWAGGLSTSLQAALAALPENCAAALFLPADQPFVPVILLRRLWQCWREGGDLAAPSVEGSLRGAPAVFDRIFWPELRQVQGDVGGRPLLTKYRAEVRTVAAMAQWLQDIDTPMAWESLKD